MAIISYQLSVISYEKRDLGIIIISLAKFGQLFLEAAILVTQWQYLGFCYGV